VLQNPPEASQMSSITLSWDSLSDELKKPGFLFSKEWDCGGGNQLLAICLHMVNEPVFNTQLLLRITLIKHICCAAEHGGQNFHLKMKTF